MRGTLYGLLAAGALLGGIHSTWAQKYPERSMLRSGNAFYQREDWAEAETRYRKAQEMTPTLEGQFNLCDVLYKQKRYDEAAQILTQIAKDEVAGPFAADAYYNLGNTYFQQKKLQEAAEAYKNTLRRNPKDEQARYNLAYVLSLMQNNQDKDQDKDNQQNKDQNKDQNGQQPPKKDPSDQNKDNKKDNKDKGDNQQDPDQQPPKDSGKDSGGKEPQQGEGQPQPGEMGRDEAERMLEAMQANEDNTKKKVDGRKVRVVGRSGKNW